ncbi:VAMP-like protein YKT61 [Diplonema papillatum]|nr:VAMP-like protein YKT61 [Diplonema papillatum]KAJ9464895.1 VAMP-like protein YKT61 [Diplonema papillatum]
MAEKMYSISVFKTRGSGEEPIVLASAMNVSSFSILQRSGAKEFITFISRTVAGRTQPNTRQQVVEQEYRAYTHARSDGLACVVCTNEPYPERVAFALCNQTMTEFTEAFAGQYETATNLKDNHFDWPQLTKTLTKYQNPREADQVLKIQKDLEEIQTLMLQNMDKVMTRGDNINDLVEKSGDLSYASKTFYKTAKKTNRSCCIVM